MLFRKKIKKQFVITIPEPCNEDWNQMRVVDSCHRNCAACDRVLTDFAQMNDDELLLFFAQSQGKICGRFRKDQLNRPITPLPERTTRATWWKAAALLPLTLLSKNINAQQLYPDSVKTEQVPFMVNNDSVPFAVVDTKWICVPNVQWDSLRPYWLDGEYDYVGIPQIQYDFHLDFPLCVTSDFYVVQPPKTESALGLLASGPSQAVAIGKKGTGADAGRYFGAAIAPDPNNS